MIDVQINEGLIGAQSDMPSSKTQAALLAEEQDRLRADKRAVRAQMKLARRSLSADYLSESSAAISSALDRLVATKGMHTVMLYRALPGEVDVNLLADSLIAKGVIVVLPRVVGDIIQVRRYEGPKSLEKGSFGIMEPLGPLYEGAIDMVAVPGLSFDAAGGRLGFGRGFYDRFLSTLYPKPLKVGLCFERMLLDKIPVEPHDVPMDIVLTEKRG